MLLNTEGDNVSPLTVANELKDVVGGGPDSDWNNKLGAEDIITSSFSVVLPEAAAVPHPATAVAADEPVVEEYSLIHVVAAVEEVWTVEETMIVEQLGSPQPLPPSTSPPAPSTPTQQVRRAVRKNSSDLGRKRAKKRPAQSKPRKPVPDYRKCMQLVNGSGELVRERGVILPPNHTSCAFLCEYCGKKFPRHYNFLAHKRRLHNSERVDEATTLKNYQCHLCPCSYKYVGGLQGHFKLKHGPVIPQFVCKTCKLKFNSYNTLKRHAKNTCSGTRSGCTIYET